MNKTTKAILVCLALLVIGLIYKEASIYKERRHISEKIQSIELLTVKYGQILNETGMLKRKYAILKNRNLKDQEAEKTLAKIEIFLEKAVNIKIKYDKLVEDKIILIKKYNSISQQVLFYHGSLPKIMKSET